MFAHEHKSGDCGCPGCSEGWGTHHVNVRYASGPGVWSRHALTVSACVSCVLRRHKLLPQLKKAADSWSSLGITAGEVWKLFRECTKTIRWGSAGQKRGTVIYIFFFWLIYYLELGRTRLCSLNLSAALELVCLPSFFISTSNVWFGGYVKIIVPLKC